MMTEDSANEQSSGHYGLVVLQELSARVIGIESSSTAITFRGRFIIMFLRRYMLLYYIDDNCTAESQRAAYNGVFISVAE